MFINSVPTDKKFTGQRLDGTGLYYYGARYYDPLIGRFISPDTIVPNPANSQSFNRYSYALNNPLKYMDPSGHMQKDPRRPPRPPNPPPPPRSGSSVANSTGGGTSKNETTIPFDLTVTAEGSWEVLLPKDHDYPYAWHIKTENWMVKVPWSFIVARHWAKWIEEHDNRGQVAQVRVYGEVTISDIPGYPLIIEVDMKIEGEGISPSNPVFHGYKNDIFDENITKIPLTGGQSSIYVDRNITPNYIQIDFTFLPRVGFYDVKLNYDSLVVDLQTGHVFK